MLCLTAAALVAGPVRAHEVPLQTHLDLWAARSADGAHLQVIVRAPLDSLQDLTLHTHADGSLDLDAMHDQLEDAARVWIGDFLTVQLDGRPLPDTRVVRTRVDLPERALDDHFSAALARVTGPPLPADARVWREQGSLDILIEAPLPPGTELGDLSLQPRFEHLGLGVESTLRVRGDDGTIRTVHYLGDPGSIDLAPGPFTAASTFVVTGVEHILGGTDHVLFLLALVLPVLRLRPLIAIITAFTLAHSITLIGSALGLAPRAAWFPPLVETLIAATIVWMAIENLLTLWPGRTGTLPVGPVHRWRLAFLFGLVHGFGFSFVLADQLQYAGEHLLVALLSFNVGVEIGQLALLVVAVPVLRMVAARLPAGALCAIASVLIAHTAWHWLLDRGAVFAAYPLAWPGADLVVVRGAMQFAIVLLIAGAAYWLLARLFRRWLDGGEPPLPDA